MTKETLLEILNKKIEVAKKDLDYCHCRCQIAGAKLDLLEGLIDELLTSESEGEKSEKGEQKKNE